MPGISPTLEGFRATWHRPSLTFAEMPDEVNVASNQIIRCDNDPSLPEHGSIQITILGGK